MSSSAQAASAPDSFFTAPLSEADPEIAAAIKGELGRQRHEIELIASENIVSRAVLEAQGSVMTNKYAEGYPGARYYGGCEWVDVAENLAIDRAKKLFGAGFALKALWWIAIVVLVVWLLGFVMRSTTSGGGRGRWYRW